ncbi:uncharacterized protein [Ptychodera flava]|uniref:uncharacterized protein n=1 Tax=Ptychodera flava TaxID=63121 RepID=UPI003969FA54
MFATVTYGDNQSFLINLRCGSRNVFEYVNDKLAEEDWEDDTFVELCDEDGQLKYLSYQSPMRMLSDYVKPRSTLIPIKIERDENDSYKPFKPMLKADFKPRFRDRLQRQRDKMEKLRLEREQSELRQERRLESVKEEEKPKEKRSTEGTPAVKRQASGTSRPASKGNFKRS